MGIKTKDMKTHAKILRLDYTGSAMAWNAGMRAGATARQVPRARICGFKVVKLSYPHIKER